MLVKLVMPEISGDDAAQKWMWWQRLGFFKPKRLMQFGKFINTGEIGYNLCLAALYCRRRGCLPGKTTTDSTLFLCTILDKDFCKHQFGVVKSAHQARLDLRPPRRRPSGAKTSIRIRRLFGVSFRTVRERPRTASIRVYNGVGATENCFHLG